MPDTLPIRDFYDQLNSNIDLKKENGAPLKFREFVEVMRDDEWRKKFYHEVSPYVDLGDFQSFNEKAKKRANEVPKDYVENDPTMGRTHTAVNQFANSFMQILPSVMTHAAETVSNIPLPVMTTVPNEALGLTIERGAEKLREKTALPVNVKYANELLAGKIPSVAGSITGFMLATALAKGANIPPMLAGGLLGAMTFGADEYRKTLQETGDYKKAYESLLTNSAIGSTMAIPMTKQLERLNWLFKGEVRHSLALIKAGGIDQAVQFAAMRFLQNASAKEIYDTERNLFDGVGEAGLTGFFSAVGLNALGVAAHALGKKIFPIEEGKELVKKEAHLTKEELSAEEKLRMQIENSIGVSTTGGKFEAETAIRLLRGLSEYTGKPIHELVSFEPATDAKGDLLQEMVVKHGSPYVFEKFSLKYVGTGEGVNARGHGLYFSDLEKVAEFYAKTTGKNLFDVARGLSSEAETYTAKRVKELGAEKAHFVAHKVGTWLRAYYMLKKSVESDVSVKDFIKRKIKAELSLKQKFEKEDSDYARAYLQFLDDLSLIMKDKTFYKGLEDIYNRRPTLGQVYEAKIKSKDPKAFRWLDWDEVVGKEEADLIKARLMEEMEISEYPEHIQQIIKNLDEGVQIGSNLYNFLSSYFGSPSIASTFLREAGIDGIRYPTGSMTAFENFGKGNNYVIFDDNAVQIIKRNPLYQPTKGAIRFTEEGKAFIQLTKLSDVSTIVHEFAHLARHYLSPEDMKTVREWMGIKEKRPLTVEEEEDFARAFEHWVSEGRTTATPLKEIFLKLKDMFVKIYGEIRKSVIGVDYSPEMEMLFDRLVGGTELMSQGEKLKWAYSQIDKSYWLNQIYGSDPANLRKVNIGLEHSAVEGGVDPTKIETELNDVRDINYERPRKVWSLAQAFKFPLWTLYKMRVKSEHPDTPSLAENFSYKFIKSQMYLNHLTNEWKSWVFKLRPIRILKVFGRKTALETEKALTPALEIIYKLRDPEVPSFKIAELKKQLAELYAKHPGLQKIIDGADERGGIITFFEHVKDMYKEALRKEYRINLSEEMYGIFEDVIDKGKSVNEAIRRWIDVEEVAKKEWIAYKKDKGVSEEKALEQWEKGGKKVETKKEKVFARLVRELDRKVIQPYLDIDEWGMRDYIAKIELGNYVIYDYDGKVIGYAENIAKAKMKARKIRAELRAKGEDKGPLPVKANVSRINPTASREFKLVDENGKELARVRDFEEARAKLRALRKEGKKVYLEHGVLKGEENLFEVFPAYIHTMAKRIATREVLAEYNKALKEHPEEFPADVRAILEDQVKELLGENYSWMDRIFDEISVAHGWKTGKARTVVRWSKSAIANLALGYRAFAPIINELTGFRQTYVKVGTEFFMKARDALIKGKYVGKDGEVINLDEKLDSLERSKELGLDFAVDATGTVKTRVKWYKPLGMFSNVEKPVRRHSFVANYILGRERYGLNDEQATEFAIKNVWFQQTIYDTAALPKVLRSTEGQLIGQFKPFFINQMHFLASLRGWEIPRYLATELIIGGPRAMIYLLKSVPILAAFGVLESWMDKVEHWMLTSDSVVAQGTRGIFGIVGADLTPAVAFQFPKRWDEWLGPTISKVGSLFSEVIVPSMNYALLSVSGADEKDKPAYIGDHFIDWAKGLSPLMYYWDQLIDDVVTHWDYGDEKTTFGKFKRTFQQPDIWIRDSHGRKAYIIGGFQDRLLLMGGAAPLPLSEQKVKRKLLKSNFEIRKENRKWALDKITKKLVEGKSLSEEDMNDLLLYGIDPSSIPNAVRWKEMTPEQRLIFKQNLLDRIDAIDMLGF